MQMEYVLVADAFVIQATKDPHAHSLRNWDLQVS